MNKKDILSLGKANFCVIKYFHQYTEGVTGSNRSLTVYTNGGVGFKTKKLAKDFFTTLKEKSSDKFKNKKGTPGPYGEVGCVHYDIQFLTTDQLSEYLEKYSYQYPNFK